MDELRGYVLHEISQTQKDKYYVIPLNEDSEIVTFKERESEIVVSGDRKMRGISEGIQIFSYTR